MNSTVKDAIETAVLKISSKEAFEKDNARLESMKYLLPKLFERPLFGNGSRFFLEELDINTNTPLTLATVYGIAFGGIFIYLLYVFCKKATNNRAEKLGLFALLMFSLFSQYMPHNGLVWLLCMFACCAVERRDIKNVKDFMGS